MGDANQSSCPQHVALLKVSCSEILPPQRALVCIVDTRELVQHKLHLRPTHGRTSNCGRRYYIFNFTAAVPLPWRKCDVQPRQNAIVEGRIRDREQKRGGEIAIWRPPWHHALASSSRPIHFCCSATFGSTWGALGKQELLSRDKFFARVTLTLFQNSRWLAEAKFLSHLTHKACCHRHFEALMVGRCGRDVYSGITFHCNWRTIHWHVSASVGSV